MCIDCYRDLNVGIVINDSVLSVIKKIENVYDFSCTGGNLHIQLDDWNIEDHFFQSFEIYDPETQDDQEEAEKECFLTMKSLTLDERATALAIYDKLIPGNGWEENSEIAKEILS